MTGGMAGGLNNAMMAQLESLEIDESNADDIINNVEKLISAEKSKDKAINKDKKAESKALDLMRAGSA